MKLAFINQTIFCSLGSDSKLRKSGPAFVPIIHEGKALGVKFQCEKEAQDFLDVVHGVQEQRSVQELMGKQLP